MCVCSVTSDVFDSSSLSYSSLRCLLQARILERVAIPFSRGSSQTKNQTHVSCAFCTVGKIFSAEPLVKPCFTFLMEQNNSGFSFRLIFICYFFPSLSNELNQIFVMSSFYICMSSDITFQKYFSST